MSYELLIALRYLRGRHKQTSISVVTGIAIVGVALGVASLIVVLAVMTGFQNEIRNRILGTNAHIVVFDRADQPIEDWENWTRIARSVPGVREASGFIITKAMARSRTRSEGAVLKGIEPERAEKVLSLGQDLLEGDLSLLHEPLGETKRGAVWGILLGKLLAENLEVQVGDRLEMLIPEGRTEEGDAILQVFQVAGIFESRMFEYDSVWAYTSLQATQQFLGLEEHITRIEISVDDIWQSRHIEGELSLALGPHFLLQDWQRMNGHFFAALQLQKQGMFLILCLIVLVAAFNVVSTLTLMVLEKRREIGILKAMGASWAGLLKVFLLQGMVIGTLGTALGVVLGSLLAWSAETFQLIRLEGEVYFLTHLPFEQTLSDTLLICLASLFISFCTTLLPSARAARLHAIDTIRYE